MNFLRIKRLVTELFFRQNQQHFRNKKYKKKQPDPSRSMSVRGRSDTDPIELSDASPYETTFSETNK